MEMTVFPIGRSRVEKIHELDLDGFAATRLLPGLDPQLPERHPEWIPPGTYDAEGHALHRDLAEASRTKFRGQASAIRELSDGAAEIFVG